MRGSRALLGPDLARWKAALPEGVAAPELRGGVIFATPEDAHWLLDGINAIVRDARGINYVHVGAALGPLCTALAVLWADN